MRTFLPRLLGLLALIFLTGCVTRNTLDSRTTALNLPSKSVVLATLDMSQRDGKSRGTPWPRWIVVMPEGAKVPQLLAVDEEGMDYSDPKHSTAYIRIELPPGRYRLVGLYGTGMIYNGWTMPMNFEIDVPPTSVLYMGRITAEFYQGGYKFDMWVSDQSALDLSTFRSTFPALRAVDIRTQLLRFSGPGTKDSGSTVMVPAQ